MSSNENETVNGISLDTFKDLVFMEDVDYGYTTSLTVDQAFTLANRLTRYAKKAERYLS